MAELNEFIATGGGGKVFHATSYQTGTYTNGSSSVVDAVVLTGNIIVDWVSVQKTSDPDNGSSGSNQAVIYIDGVQIASDSPPYGSPNQVKYVGSEEMPIYLNGRTLRVTHRADADTQTQTRVKYKVGTWEDMV